MKGTIYRGHVEGITISVKYMRKKALQATVNTGGVSIRDPEAGPGNDQVQKKRAERCQDGISFELSGSESL